MHIPTFKFQLNLLSKKKKKFKLTRVPRKEKIKISNFVNKTKFKKIFKSVHILKNKDM